MGHGKVIGFYRLHGAPWAIMLHAQASQITGALSAASGWFTSAGGVLCLVVILLLIRLGVNPLVSAIRLISRRASEVAAGEYGEPLPVTSRDEIGQLTGSFNDMVAGLKERDFIRNTFGRYVDEEIARKLLRRPEAARRLGGEKREVVIMFSDIRGFTPLAESLSPEATIRLVNRHFSRMIEVIRAHHGIIVDFLGDAVLAFFDPLDHSLEEAVRQAVACALEMQEAQAAANAAVTEYPPLQMGIGLHAGEVVVGNIGSESRAKYGIVGSAVNLTHRIQGQAQGGEVVVSEAVPAPRPGPSLAVQREFRTRLKGIQEPVSLLRGGGFKARMFLILRSSIPRNPAVVRASDKQLHVSRGCRLSVLLARSRSTRSGDRYFEGSAAGLPVSQGRISRRRKCSSSWVAAKTLEESRANWCRPRVSRAICRSKGAKKGQSTRSARVWPKYLVALRSRGTKNRPPAKNSGVKWRSSTTRKET